MACIPFHALLVVDVMDIGRTLHVRYMDFVYTVDNMIYYDFRQGLSCELR